MVNAAAYFEVHRLEIGEVVTDWSTHFVDKVAIQTGVSLSANSGGMNTLKPSDPCFIKLSSSHGRRCLIGDESGHPSEIMEIDDCGLPSYLSMSIKGIAPGQVWRNYTDISEFVPLPDGSYGVMGLLMDGTRDRVFNATDIASQKGAVSEIPLAYVYPTEEYLGSQKVEAARFNDHLRAQAEKLGIKLEEGVVCRSPALMPGNYRLNEVINMASGYQAIEGHHVDKGSLFYDPNAAAEYHQLISIIELALDRASANLGAFHNSQNGGGVLALGYRHYGNITSEGYHVDWDSAYSSHPKLDDPLGVVLHRALDDYLTLFDQAAENQLVKPQLMHKMFDQYFDHGGRTAALVSLMFRAKVALEMPGFRDKNDVSAFTDFRPHFEAETGFGLSIDPGSDFIGIGTQSTSVVDMIPLIDILTMVHDKKPFGLALNHVRPSTKLALADHFGVEPSEIMDQRLGEAPNEGFFESMLLMANYF